MGIINSMTKSSKWNSQNFDDERHNLGIVFKDDFEKLKKRGK